MGVSVHTANPSGRGRRWVAVRFAKTAQNAVNWQMKGQNKQAGKDGSGDGGGEVAGARLLRLAMANRKL